MRHTIVISFLTSLTPSTENVQITLFRDDEHMVGLDEQSFRDQFNRHLGEARENLVKLCKKAVYFNENAP
jgi:hypothetical protein